MILLCGFRGTGKDTFYNNLIEGKLNNYVFYSQQDKKLTLKSNYTRVAFADNVKKEVNILYNTKYNINSSINKDSIIYENVTYRDLLIKHALFRKEKDINYWVKHACNWKKCQNIMITDFRFPHEHDYIISHGYKPLTIRLFRSEVIIPTHESERALDDFTTDFLVLPRQNHSHEYNKVISIFPQYKSFKTLVSCN